MPDPLVRAMFTAELDGMLLSSGHDLSALDEPVCVDLASGPEADADLRRAEKTPPAGDLVMRDAQRIVASVLLGPDSRTAIRAGDAERALHHLRPSRHPRAGHRRADGLDRVPGPPRLPGARAGARRIMRL